MKSSLSKIILGAFCLLAFVLYKATTSQKVRNTIPQIGKKEQAVERVAPPIPARSEIPSWKPPGNVSPFFRKEILRESEIRVISGVPPGVLAVEWGGKTMVSQVSQIVISRGPSGQPYAVFPNGQSIEVGPELAKQIPPGMLFDFKMTPAPRPTASLKK